MYNNKLSGSIPSEWGRMPKLGLIALHKNSLSGSIPTELGSAPLRQLWLAKNSLSGTIPTELGLSTFLSSLWLGHNQLTGTIPSEVGSSSNLFFLNLASNSLKGTIPSEFQSLTSKLDGALFLQENFLTGVVDDWVCDLSLKCKYKGPQGHWDHCGYNLTNNFFSCPLPFCCSSEGNGLCEPCQANTFV
mmetsp:Transcript_5999/g.9081  ORF Transcript_5999/g.9081 Transcript_5999/m.9081 type:complete len:189 (-) Transcript_5999:69-635(-)